MAGPALPTFDQILGRQRAEPAPPQRDTLADILGASAVRAYGNLRYGLPAALERNLGTLTPEDERYYAAWNAQKAADAQAIAPVGAASFDDVTSGRAGPLTFLGENIAAMLPQVGATVAGGLVGGPGGAVAVGTPLFMGANASRALEESGGISAEQAAKATLAAPVQAAADVFGMRYMPGFGKVLGPLAARFEGNVLARGVKGAASGAVAEALTETGQQALERWSAGLPLDDKNAQAELVQAFGTAALLGGALGGVGGMTRKKIAQQGAAQTSTADLAQYVDGVLALPSPQPAGELDLGQALDGVEPIIGQPSQAPKGFGTRVLPTDDPTSLAFARAPQPPPGSPLTPSFGFDPTAPEQLGLPTEAGFGAALDRRRVTFGDSFTQEPQIGATIEGERTPAMLQLPAPRSEQVLNQYQPELPPGPEVYVDAAGRAQPRGIDQILATPRVSETPADVPQLTYNPADEPGVGTPLKPLDDLTRMLGETPTPRLRAVLERTSDPEVAAAVERELVARAAKPGGIDAPAAAAPTFSFDEVTRGVRMTADLKKLRGASEQDFDAGIRALLEKGDARASTLAVAEKRGLLAEPASPAANPDVVPNAPDDVVAAFAERSPEARRALAGLMAPGELTELRMQVLERLAADPEMPAGMTREDVLNEALDTPRGKQPPGESEVGRGQAKLRRVAFELGLVNETGELTGEGEAIARKSPAPTEEVIKAGQAQGFEGAQLAAFERGAQGTEVTSFDSLSDMGAYVAGQRWKVPPVGTAEATRGVMYGTPAAPGVPAAPGLMPEGKSLKKAGANKTGSGRIAPVTPAQARVQSLLAAVDQRPYPAATRPEELAQLKRAIQDGATDEQVNAMDTMLREGQSFFPEQPAQPARYAGEAVVDTLGGPSVVATRGAPRSDQFEDLGLGPQATRREIAAERRKRAEARTAKQAERLTAELKAALASGDLTPGEYGRLYQKVQKRDFAGVVRGLPGGMTKLSLREYIGPGVEYDNVIEMEQLLADKDFDNALKVLQTKAPNAFYRKLAREIAQAVKALRGVGMTFEIKVLRPGDQMPPELEGAQGGVNMDAQGMTLYLMGAETQNPGTDYETLAHEMSHVATMPAIDAATNGRNPTFAKSRAGQAAIELAGVFDQVEAHFANRAKQGNLTAFERQVISGRTNAAEDMYELASWAMTNPEMQAYLDTVRVSRSQTLWDRVVEALRKFFGLAERDTNALEAVLRLSERIMQADYRLLPGLGTTSAGLIKSRHPTVGEMGQSLKSAVPQLAAAIENIEPMSWSAKARKVLYSMFSTDHMAAQYGDMLPGLRQLTAIDQERHATQAKLAQLHAGFTQAFGQLKPKYQDLVNKLARATEFNMDPAKLWRDQPWLHGLPNAALLKTELAQLNQDVGTLKRNNAYHVYEQAKALNEVALYSEVALQLHSLVHMDEQLRQEVKGFETDPADAYRLSAEASRDVMAAQRYWKDTVERQFKAAEAHIEGIRGSLAGLKQGEQNKAEQHLSPLEAMLRQAKGTIERAKQAPYFHLGRHGDQFASFTLRSAKGLAGQRDMASVAQAFADAGFDAYVSTSSTDPKIYMRFDSPDQRAAADGVIKQLEARGLLSTDKDTEAKSGPREAAGFSLPGREGWLDEMIQRLAADPMFDTEGLGKDEKAEVIQRRDAYLGQLRQIWVDSQSDTSLVKVMTQQRKSRPGYAKDMMRNLAQRYQMSTLSLANLSAAPKAAQAFAQMRDAVNQARRIDAPNHKNVDQMFILLNEQLTRHYQRGAIERTVAADRFRAVANAWGLAASPAYLVTQMTQIPVLLLPELGKTHGFIASSKAIAKVTGAAFRVMGAVWSEAMKQQGVGKLDAIADMAITPAVLDKAGLSPGQKAFLVRLIASGVVDIGSAARELGRVSEGVTDHTLDRTLRWASSFGLYAETTTRLIAGLAAYDLHKGEGADAYAQSVINEAMLNYAASNTARAMGKMGKFGEFTPIMTQFMQYSVQVMQKLYREGYTMFKGETKAQRLAAAKFLAGHLAAVTALAGTLGLPFATVAAVVFENLHDLFDDDEEPYDATASYRNWLAGIFGPELADAAARGLPRAAGFDMSSRVGEQNLLPGSQFWADRHNIKDAAMTQALNAFGPGTSMGVNFAAGVEHLLEGNLELGMIEMMPVALKNPAKAMRLGTQGYTNLDGEKLPIETPGSAAVLTQLLGFTTTDKAYYQEKAGDLKDRSISLTRRAKVLRTQLVRAVMDGDMEAIRELAGEAQAFDADNPAFAVLPDIEGAIARRQRNMAIAKATGMPLGTRPQDLGARELVQY